MKSEVMLSADAEHVKMVRSALKENNGYCPCSLDKTRDTICMCKEFRDLVASGKTGTCHCGLYTAIAKEE